MEQTLRTSARYRDLRRAAAALDGTVSSPPAAALFPFWRQARQGEPAARLCHRTDAAGRLPRAGDRRRLVPVIECDSRDAVLQAKRCEICRAPCAFADCRWLGRRRSDATRPWPGIMSICGFARKARCGSRRALNRGELVVRFLAHVERRLTAPPPSVDYTVGTISRRRAAARAAARPAAFATSIARDQRSSRGTAYLVDENWPGVSGLYRRALYSGRRVRPAARRCPLASVATPVLGHPGAVLLAIGGGSKHWPGSACHPPRPVAGTGPASRRIAGSRAHRQTAGGFADSRRSRGSLRRAIAAAVFVARWTSRRARGRRADDLAANDGAASPA